MAKILFVSIPLAGHLNPQIGLAQMLQRNGYEVVMVTTKEKQKLIESLGLRCVTILDDFQDEFQAIINVAQDMKIKHSLQRMFHTLSAIDTFFIEAYHEFLTILKIEQPALCIHDFSTFFASYACEALKIPFMTDLPSHQIIESVNLWDDVPYFMGGLYPQNGFFGKLRNRMGWFILKNVKRWYGRRRIFKENGWRVYRKDGSENYYSNQTVLGLGMKEIEFNSSLPKYLQHIGPSIPSVSIKNGERKLPSGFDKYIFFTFGTILEGMNDQLQSAYFQLIKQFPEYLFVLSDGNLNKADEEPIWLANNLIRYGYLSYSENINQFDLVVHHGGIGIAYDCIKWGIPSIVFPQVWDQFDFAARLDHFGASIRIKEAEEMADAIRQAQVYDWSRLYQLQNQLKKYDTERNLIKLVDAILKGVEK